MRTRLETRNNVNPNVLFTYFLSLIVKREFSALRKKATFKIARRRDIYLCMALRKRSITASLSNAFAKQRGILDQTVKDRNGRMQECKRIVKGSRSLPSVECALLNRRREDQKRRRERIFPDTFAGRRHLLVDCEETWRRLPPTEDEKKRSLKAVVISALVSVLTHTYTHENFSIIAKKFVR